MGGAGTAVVLLDVCMYVCMYVLARGCWQGLWVWIIFGMFVCTYVSVCCNYVGMYVVMYGLPPMCCQSQPNISNAGFKYSN